MATQSTRKPTGATRRATASPGSAAAPRPARSRAATRKGNGVRPVAAGDVAPARSQEAVDRYAVKEAVAAANEHEIAAISDILKGEAPADREALMQTLLQQSKVAVRARQADPDLELANDWRKGGYPYKNLLSRRSYERQKYRLQVELLKLQAWVKESGQKVVILFEGRDAAGKGGTIRRFMEHLNPRGARVVALEKPSEYERGQWYLQRYVQHGRQHLAGVPGEQALFLNQRGTVMSRQGLWLVVKRWARAAGLGEDVSPHSLRHSLAHHLLGQGKSKREVQQILGLSSPNAIRVQREGGPT